MPRTLPTLHLLLLGFLMSTFCGCGVPPQSAETVTPSPSNNLAGNWLIFGALPTTEIGTTVSQGLAVGFNVVGNSIIASATAQTTCSSGVPFGLTYGPLLNGTIAADGTFTVSSPVNSGAAAPPVLTLQGTVPRTAGGAWAGTYTISTAGLPATPGSSCTFSQSAPFTASAIADVTGTYTGMATLPGPTAMPIGITLTLQQGATLYTLVPGVTAYSRLGLSGSLQIQGVSCFSKGSVSTSTPSELDGNRVTANFLMDDGSTLRLLGSIVDMSSSHLAISSFEVTGGQCSGIYGLGLLIVGR